MKKFLNLIKGSALILTTIWFSSCDQDERAMVVGKIQQASDLVTSEFVIDKVVFGKKSRNLLWFRMNEAKFLAYSQAKVKTGIDLKKIKEEDIIIEGNKITLNLPSIEVITFSYPPSSFVEDSLISNPDRFLNSISLEDQEEFFRMAETDIRNNLQYLGLVKSSQEHTRKLLNTLLSSLGFQEIYIHFQDDRLVIPMVNLQYNEDES
ncbi:DUF4230 domain-containing protein [Negadavirga shengliensis]|uniref:DUF4230 domain-containing protein n=1 Tax=Negadavirga shengliensis TaxID=1389218 RepID=A0ABV9SZT3_9BACT